jgi:4-amino-4-deoxy-L-arabinose transferase-like glycosyltransferase
MIRWPPLGRIRPGYPAALAAIVAVAFALRLGWIAFIDDGLPKMTLPPLEDRGPAYVELLTERLTDDQAFYVRSAQYLAEGEGYREPFSESVTARWPPGYPLVLAALFAVVGPSLLAAQLLNAVLGALTVALVYLLGARLFDRRVGLTGAALVAFLPGQVFFSGLLMTEVPFTAGLLAILLLILARLSAAGPSAWRWLVVAGLAIGGLAMVRGEVALLAPLLGVYWVAKGVSWRRAAAQVGVVVAAMAVIFVPWAIRNAVQLDTAVVLTTGTGGALIQGHAEGAGGGLDQGIYNSLRAQYADLPEPERQVAENNQGTRESLEFMITHPLDELRLIPEKLYYLYRTDPGELTWAQLRRFGVRGEGVLQRLGDGLYFLVLWLTLLGTVMVGRWMFRGDRLLLPLVVVMWSFVYGFVYVGDGRYHFPLVPLFSILAAFFVWWLVTGRAKEGRKAEVQAGTTTAPRQGR